MTCSGSVKVKKKGTPPRTKYFRRVKGTALLKRFSIGVPVRVRAVRAVASWRPFWSVVST